MSAVSKSGTAHHLLHHRHHQLISSQLSSLSTILSRSPISRSSQPCRYIFRIVVFFIIFSFLSAFLLVKVDNYVSRVATGTKTFLGHNLDPTPWHPFTPFQFNDGTTATKYSTASNMIQCSSYLKCSTPPPPPPRQHYRNSTATCPSFFRWIHRDLEPWAQSKISQSKVMEAQKFAAFRVVIVNGRLYVDYYYACVQTRAMFTIWGLLQLMKRYPGMIPDVDLMFDCMDKPFVSRGKFKPGTKFWPPPPLFRYCTTDGHFDMPFPDWSFWGWVETNIQPWDEEFRSIKNGSRGVSWKNKLPHAYWKGNPDVGSAVRKQLLRCNNTQRWGAQILRQNWLEEGKTGFAQSKLANQCQHRYKIYAEGSAWSVSLKYIVSCGSTTLLISSWYQDFFTRGLFPKENYWPVSRANNRLCRSIKFAVDWGNSNPSEAEAIGKAGQDLMENLSMDRVYDYMYHLIKNYAELQDFKPSPPPTAQEVCAESMLCLADPKQRQFLEKSMASPSSSLPCNLAPANQDLIEKLIQSKYKVIKDVEDLENKKM